MNIYFPITIRQLEIRHHFGMYSMKKYIRSSHIFKFKNTKIIQNLLIHCGEMSVSI